MPIYVVIAAVMSLFVLCLTMESLLTPVLFLASIGIAILVVTWEAIHSFLRRIFLHNKGTDGDSSAGCDDGLFHLPAPQL